MKEVKVKCEWCPRNKQYSKKTQKHKCICCDRNPDCKHQKGTVQEQEVDKLAQVKAKLDIWSNPFTNEREKMTRIRYEKIMYLWNRVERMHFKEFGYEKERLLLDGRGVSTDDKDLRTGLIEKEWIFTWPQYESWLEKIWQDRQEYLNIHKNNYY